MRISEMADASSLIGSLSLDSEEDNRVDLSWLTGTVTEMAQLQTDESSTESSSVVVKLSETATELKRLTGERSTVKSASETLARMLELAETDFADMSDEDKIAAGVEYDRLRRQLRSDSSRSSLAEDSTAAAKENDTKDVIAEALSTSLGSPDAADKLADAQSFVSDSLSSLDDEREALQSEKKTLIKSMTSLYDTARGVES